MTTTYLRKRVLKCFGIQNMFDMYANVLVDAIYVYSYSLGMVLQQKRLEANKVDDCKCFAHVKKTKCFCRGSLCKTMQKLPRRIC